MGGRGGRRPRHPVLSQCSQRVEQVLEGGPVARINVLRNTYLPGPATSLRQEMLIETRDEEYAPKVHVAANVGQCVVVDHLLVRVG